MFGVENVCNWLESEYGNTRARTHTTPSTRRLQSRYICTIRYGQRKNWNWNNTQRAMLLDKDRPECSCPYVDGDSMCEESVHKHQHQHISHQHKRMCEQPLVAREQERAREGEWDMIRIAVFSASKSKVKANLVAVNTLWIWQWQTALVYWCYSTISCYCFFYAHLSHSLDESSSCEYFGIFLFVCLRFLTFDSLAAIRK